MHIYLLVVSESGRHLFVSCRRYLEGTEGKMYYRPTHVQYIFLKSRKIKMSGLAFGTTFCHATISFFSNFSSATVVLQ